MKHLFLLSLITLSLPLVGCQKNDNVYSDPDSLINYCHLFVDKSSENSTPSFREDSDYIDYGSLKSYADFEKLVPDQTKSLPAWVFYLPDSHNLRSATSALIIKNAQGENVAASSLKTGAVLLCKHIYRAMQPISPCVMFATSLVLTA